MWYFPNQVIFWYLANQVIFSDQVIFCKSGDILISSKSSDISRSCDIFKSGDIFKSSDILISSKSSDISRSCDIFQIKRYLADHVIFQIMWQYKITSFFYIWISLTSNIVLDIKHNKLITGNHIIFVYHHLIC